MKLSKIRCRRNASSTAKNIWRTFTKFMSRGHETDVANIIRGKVIKQQEFYSKVRGKVCATKNLRLVAESSDDDFTDVQTE